MTDETVERSDGDHAQSGPLPGAKRPRSSRGFQWFTALLLLNVGGAGVYCWYQYVRDPDYDAIAETRAFAEIRIRRQRPTLLFYVNPPETERDFLVYKQTHAKLVKSKFVLAAAMRKPRIAQLKLLQQQTFPFEWLEDHLEVDFPAEEFMRISLDAPMSHDAVAIVNSVCGSYLSEVVESGQTARKQRRKNLEDIHRSIEDKLRAKENAVRKLAEALSSGDSQTLTLKQQLAIEKYGQVRKHHAEIQYELLRVRTQLAVKPESESPDAADIERLVDNDPVVVRLTVERDILKELIAQRTATPADGDGKKTEPPRLQDDKHRLQAAETTLGKRREIVRKAVGKLGAITPGELLQVEVERLEVMKKRLRQEMESREITAKRIGIESFELEILKKDIEQRQAVADSLAEELQKLEIELGAPARVTGFQKAVYRKAKGTNWF